MRRGRGGLAPTRATAAWLAWLVVLGCGGSRVATPPPRAEPALLRGSVPAAPEDVVGATWRYASGRCTEGILEMGVRGYAEAMRAHEVPNGVVFVSDRVFAEEGCVQTVVLHARRVSPGEGDDPPWRWSERARVTYPAGERCDPAMTEEVAGDLRWRDGGLELYVQRAPWCGGYDAALRYERRGPDAGALDGDAADARLLRHVLAHLQDRDATALAAHYTGTGVHVDPQRPGPDGRPARHVGRAAVEAFFASVFHEVPWMAARLVGAPERMGAEGIRASFEYMDPRLEAPLRARLRLWVVEAGIQESEIAFGVTDAR